MTILAFVLFAGGTETSVSDQTVLLKFDQLRYAVSMTPALASKNGPIDGRSLEQRGPLSTSVSACGGVADFGDAINQQIASAGGNAAISVELEFSAGEQCTTVTARGQIVKVSK